jgi:hypothetical protein
MSNHGPRKTVEVPSEVFQRVSDSPAALPGAQRWVTPDGDGRQLEALLGMDDGVIGAPLWLSADSRQCAKCG